MDAYSELQKKIMGILAKDRPTAANVLADADEVIGLLNGGQRDLSRPVSPSSGVQVMTPCGQHGTSCPYSSEEECRQMVHEIRLAMWAADDAFKKIGGGTRHYVNEALVPALMSRGFKLARIPNVPAAALPRPQDTMGCQCGDLTHCAVCGHRALGLH